jgi:hypothetical protein
MRGPPRSCRRRSPECARNENKRVAIRWQFLPWCAKKANKAAVAQLVEQRIRNAWVGGSNPFRGTSYISYLADMVAAQIRLG